MAEQKIFDFMIAGGRASVVGRGAPCSGIAPTMAMLAAGKRYCDQECAA